MGNVARRLHETVNIPELVRLAMEEFRGDKDKAIRTLTLRTQDTAVNEAFRALGIQQAVRSYQTRERHGGSEAPVYTPRSPRTLSVGEIQARADLRVAKKLWWDRVTLFGGNVTLASATRAEVFTSSRAHGVQEKGNGNMRKFYEDVGKRMTDAKKTVSEQLTIAKVLELARAHNVIPS